MKKLICLLLMLTIICSFALVGCNKDTDTNDVADTTEDADDTADDADDTTDALAPELADGVLSIGVDDAYPPFEYHDEETNELIGFDVEFAEALAAELGVTVEWVPIAWDGIFTGLQSSSYDVIISCTSMTPERMETLIFGGPYLANGIVLVSKVGGEQAVTVEDIEGKTVGIQLETTADEAADKLIANGANFTVEKYDTIIEAFTAMDAGYFDFVLVDSGVGGFYVAQNPDKYVISSDLLTNEPIGVSIRKESTELQTAINEALAKMQEDGTMTAISEKWFSADFATNIDSELTGIE